MVAICCIHNYLQDQGDLGEDFEEEDDDEEHEDDNNGQIADHEPLDDAIARNQGQQFRDQLVALYCQN